VLTALDALTLAPERFNMESKVYLGLRSIFSQLAHAKSDDQLREVVTRLWDMAVDLEDGNLSDAQLALRNAEDALRQALERGASDEEIKRLTDELRAPSIVTCRRWPSSCGRTRRHSIASSIPTPKGCGRRICRA